MVRYKMIAQSGTMSFYPSLLNWFNNQTGRHSRQATMENPQSPNSQQNSTPQTGAIINTDQPETEERVKVDRKRFEQMLGENSTIGYDAETFFTRVMRSTNTQIMWPPKLKPGTKSKKDPHVRITGNPNSINAAKEIIFEQLDTRRNRVTLKMDVAFTDHSHIIGKGGRSIQRVMDETGCHIHFPDSNRTNTAEKSNQVSIAGSAEGVEQSRRRIREMLPITVQFDLPLNNGLHSPPTLDTQSPQLQAIQQSYGITITFRSDSTKCSNSYFASSRIITVAVRGARSHLFGLRQGLSVLIEYLTGFRANTINVPLTMTIDVAVQHHSFIGGRSNCNIRSIMQSTGAVISMPDILIGNPLTSSSTGSLPAATNSSSPSSSITQSSSSLAGLVSQSSSSISDLTSLCGQQASFMTSLTSQNLHGSNPNLASSSSNSSLVNSNSSLGNRKTAIVIKGPDFDSVYNAWQELLGYLPLILIFDLKEGQDLDAVQVTKLMEQMRQISILIKPKQRQNTKSIVVRGPERDSRLLFEVRRQILKLDDSEVPNYGALDKQQLEQQNIEHQINQMSQPLQDIHLAGVAGGLFGGKAHQDQNQQPLEQLLVNQTRQQQLQQQQQHLHHHQQQQPNHQQQQQQNIHQLSSCQTTNITSGLSIPELQMKAIKAILEPNFEKARPTPYWAGLGFSKSVSEPMINEKMAIGPLFSSNIIEERRISYANEGPSYDLANSLQSLSLDPTSSNSKIFTDSNNNYNTNTNTINNNNNNNNNNNININDNNNNNTACTSNKNQNNINMLGMTNNSHQKSTNNNNSTITNTTNNHGNNNHLNIRNLSSINTGNGNPITSGNVNQTIHPGQATSTSLTNNAKITSCLRLAMFLGRIGLVQHLGLFTKHSIDLETLFSLTENDFAELGLPYVHRRKLAIAIAEIKSSIQNERNTARSILANYTNTFDAAPGAERSRRQKAKGPDSSNDLSDIWS